MASEGEQAAGVDGVLDGLMPCSSSCYGSVYTRCSSYGETTCIAKLEVTFGADEAEIDEISLNACCISP